VYPGTIQYNPAACRSRTWLFSTIKLLRRSVRKVDNLPPSLADCFELWEPQPPVTLATCPGLYRDCLPSTRLPSRSQWPRVLRRGSAAARLLGLWVRISPGTWMSFSYVCSVVCCQVKVSETGWSLVQNSRTERGVSECDHEASTVRRSWSTRVCCAV